MTKTIEFNFTPEQQERFNIILEETKKIHPHLLIDEISKERVKVLIAYSVINGDLPIKKELDEKWDNILEEIKD